MIASRNYAYANIAAYETMVAGNPQFQSLAGQIKHLPAMPKPEAGKTIDFSLAALFSFTKVGNAVTFPEGSMMAYYDELKEKAREAGNDIGNFRKYTCFFRYGCCRGIKMEQRR